MTALKKWPLELMFWIGALVGLFYATPDNQHFALCPLHQAGFDFCPGCGIGRSIHYMMRGDIQASFSSHYLGPIALLIVLGRVFTLTRHLLPIKEKKI